MSEREEEIAKLPVEIQVSENDVNATRIVSLQDLQAKGKQNVVIAAGDFSFAKDVVISARLEGNDSFNSKDTLLIPYIVSEDDQLEDTKTKGFGKSSEAELMTAPYIAKPKQVSIFL